MKWREGSIDACRPTLFKPCRPRTARPVPRPRRAGTLLIAGATGALGNEVVRRLAGSASLRAHARAGARAHPDGLRGVETRAGAGRRRSRSGRALAADVGAGPVRAAAAVLRPRARAVDAASPAQLPALARWLRACGVRTLAVVQPHAQGRLPEALKRGLASLDEQAVAALGFERVLLVRSAQKPAAAPRPTPGRAAGGLDAVDRALHGADQRAAGARRQGGRAGRRRAAHSRRRACTWPRRSWCGGRAGRAARGWCAGWLSGALTLTRAESAQSAIPSAPCAKTKLRAATVGGTADDVEAAFYEALQRGDIDALMACWADEDEVVLRPPRRPAPGGRRRRSAPPSSDVRQRRDPRHAGARAQGRIARERGAQRAGAHRGAHRRRARAMPSCWPPTSITRPRRAGAWWRTTPAPARVQRAPDDARRRADRRSLALTLAWTTSRPRWLPGGNLQTIWPALFARRVARRRAGVPARALDHARRRLHRCRFRSMRAGAPAPQPLLVLFHGLEGSSRSHYAEAFAAFARGARLALRRAALSRLQRRAQPGAARLPLGRLRGDRLDPARACASAARAAPHAGGRRLARRQRAAALGRRGRRRGRRARARGGRRSRAPLDLAAGGAAIGRGFNRLVYTRMFLRTHEAQGAGQAGAAPGPVRPRARCWRRATCTPSTTSSPRRCTAFATPTTTGARGSAKPHLHAIRIPALVLNARNDPFVPAASLPRPDEVGTHVTLWQPAHGGHVGFPARRAGRAMCAACPSASAAGSAQHRPELRARREPRRMASWMTSSSRRSPSGPTCRTATAGSASTRAATGTCATTAPRPPGPFPAAKGSLLEHDKLIDFIQRNYEHDERGQWFFQNGPQRVYVELEAAPWVWRVRRGLRRSARTPAGGRALGLPARRGRQALPGGTASGSAWSIRRTWAWPPKRSSRGAGCRRTCAPRNCRRASAMS